MTPLLCPQVSWLLGPLGHSGLPSLWTALCPCCAQCGQPLCSDRALGLSGLEADVPPSLLSTSWNVNSSIKPCGGRGAGSSQQAALNLGQAYHRPSDVPKRLWQPHFLSQRGVLALLWWGNHQPAPSNAPCPVPSTHLLPPGPRVSTVIGSYSCVTND